MKKILYRTLQIILALLFAFLLLLAAGFFAVRFGWTNVAGEEYIDSFEYNNEAKKEMLIDREIKSNLPDSFSIYGSREIENRCKISVASKFNNYNAGVLLKVYLNSLSDTLLDRMVLAMKLRLPEKEIFEAELLECQNESKNIPTFNELSLNLASPTNSNLFAWQEGEYWLTIKEAIIKDQETINRAALKAGVQPRLLLSVAIVEQLRLYYTQRELFEKVFKPLKILANANKMSWGVMSIKEKMAITTEENLKNISSPFYPGDAYANLLDFSPDVNKDKERYNRLTNERDHYYSYLYGSLIIKEIISQWEKAGYNVEYRPEIIATLFNIGFNNSKPKENPLVGGSTIDIGGEKYFFGSLAYEFYYSGELLEEFPFN